MEARIKGTRTPDKRTRSTTSPGETIMQASLGIGVRPNFVILPCVQGV